MLSADERQVRRVRISAPRTEHVRSAAIRLEDAFRVVSLPGIDARWLVLVRRFEFGRIGPRSTSASLAAGIESRLRRLFAHAVHAEHPSAEQSPAVYFHDRHDADACLALRLATGRSPTSWFWALATPELPRIRAAPDPLLQFVLTLGRQRHPERRTILLMQSLVERGLVDRLMDGLTRSQGSELLYCHGWADSVRHEVSAHDQQPFEDRSSMFNRLSSAWAGVLERWVRAWSTDDPRSRWLVRIALLTDNPLRSLNADFSRQAQQMLDLAVRPTSIARVRIADPGAGTAQGKSAACPERPRSKEDAKPERVRPSSSATKAAVVGKDSETSRPLLTGDSRTDRVTLPAVTADQPRPSPLEHRGAQPASHQSPTSIPRVVSDILPESSGMAPLRPDNSPPSAGTSRSTEADSIAGPSDGLTTFNARVSAGSVPQTSATRAAHDAGIVSVSGAAWLRHAEPTSLAGLFFLVPLMNELGMSEFLRSSATWIECRFPWLLLGNIARRMNASGDDPILRVMVDGSAGQPQEFTPFTAPVAWKMVMSDGPVQMLRWRGPVRRWMLTDASGKLPLGYGHGQCPTGLDQFGRVQRMRRVQRLAEPDSLVVALRAWRKALNRACRWKTDLDCRDVVLRPGLIAATRTHVDLLFDMAQADVRIRKAGLDVNPGWVSWIHRVVTFHYQINERRHE